jgi:hypothetical protein
MTDDRPWPEGDADCPYDPREMTGKPIGMFHCPVCGQMVIAGMEHTPRLDDLLGSDHDR